LLNPCLKPPSQHPKTPAHRAPQSHRLDFNFFKKTVLRSNLKHGSAKKHPPGSQSSHPFFSQKKSKKRASPK
jgi:hypothetical protein